jgi:hypothetical protein
MGGVGRHGCANNENRRGKRGGSSTPNKPFRQDKHGGDGSLVSAEDALAAQPQRAGCRTDRRKRWLKLYALFCRRMRRLCDLAPLRAW